MKKLPILAATCALALFGCAHSKAGEETAANEPPMQEIENPDTQARKDREGAPTVYDGEATGGSGSHSTVTTPDGQWWFVLVEPGAAAPRTPEKNNPPRPGVREDSEVIDEGPTDDAPQQ
jgi:hypothetical protein